MSDIKIQALKPFTLRDADTGSLVSIADGSVVTMDATLGGQLISDGLAVEFTLITPTGKKTISDTSETDVTAYATAQVVDENLIAGNIKKDVVILGITGSYEA